MTTMTMFLIFTAGLLVGGGMMLVWMGILAASSKSSACERCLLMIKNREEMHGNPE